MNLDLLCKQVIEISEEVGSFLLSQDLSLEDIEEKSLNNLVTHVDKHAEGLFVSQLKELVPEAGFIAEEGTGSPSEDGFNWIIDPLDGTTNYIHQIPFFCTSVALIKNNELILGVIHDPNHEHTFHATKGGGAWLNSRTIQVSANKKLQSSLLATGFPYDDFGREDAYMELLKDFTKNTRGIRRLGSAALDLAYVAWGKFDSFYEYGLNPWDVAAGLLIVKEAGGTCSGFQLEGDPLFGEDVVASSKDIHDQILATIKRYFPDIQG